MFEYSVVCVLSASYILFCTLTSASWTSPSISKLNATDGPFNGTLTTDQASWLGSLPTLGCVVGPLLGSLLNEKVGKKTLLLMYAIPVSTAYFIMAFAKIIALFYLARVLIGISLGSLFALTPVYIAEIALNEHRGILAGIIGAFISASSVFTLATGPYMSVKSFNIMLGIFPLVFVAEFIILGLESPHYHIAKGDYDKAKQVLRKMRNCSDEKVEEEVKYLKHLIENKEQGTLYDIFRSKGMIKALVTSLTLFALLQGSGVMTIQTYSQQIFEKAGSSIAPEICALILGVVVLLVSLLVPFAMAFFGRRTLLIWSSIGTGIGQALLGVFLWMDDMGTDMSSYKMMPLLLLIEILVTANCGVMLIPMVLISEIFPNATKGVATNLSAIFTFSLSFLVHKFFPVLVDSLGQGPCFVGFSVFTFLIAIFGFFFVIETKGKALKEILDELNS